MLCGYRAHLVHFGFGRFFMAISTGLPGCGDAGTGNGAGGAAFVRFCVGALALICFPRGVRWGCAPQTCAKESSTLWTLFTLRRGCVGAGSPRRHPGTIGDLTGSDKRRPHCGWPGGSGCILLTFLALRGSKWNRHSRRAARRQRRRVGLQRAKRSACRLSLPTLRDCKIKVT